MTFPGAGARIYRNEAGEPTGWDYPNSEAPWCDRCGGYHGDAFDCDPVDDDDLDEGD